jgi:signal peptidase I
MSDARPASDGHLGAPEGAPTDGASPSGTAPVPPPHTRSRARRLVIEWAAVVVVALLGALLIRSVVLQAFWIPSASMEPTLNINDRLLVNKLSYHMHPVHRGDIVVFRRSPNMVVAENDKDLVKRVIGLPGETIESTPDGRILIDGKALSEPYLPHGTALGPPVAKQVVPPGRYFVMGDNRSDSTDSRFFGPIARSQILGRAFILIWPLSDFTLL